MGKCNACGCEVVPTEPAFKIGDKVKFSGDYLEGPQNLLGVIPAPHIVRALGDHPAHTIRIIGFDGKSYVRPAHLVRIVHGTVVFKQGDILTW